ncbi:MAG TPA: nucleoside transporter C-terminal domain-containing protein [Polyangia bacterium]|jgi:CNT family concentrative nucleoside transporter|nr:nucleoside transporter C-terminal domain-containing protein [Polyangia bacterium]
MIGLFGIAVLLGIAFAVSIDRRRALNARILLWGFGLQIAIAIFALRTSTGERLFLGANDLANDFLSFADAGIRFVFGDWPAVALVQTPTPAGGVKTVAVGFVLAVKVLPVIIFMASLMAVLYYLGVMQRVVALLARGLSRSMRISGAEALSTVGDVFLGMTEAPLLIRPYVARMTESELFAVMCAGMATIAGSVFLAYVAMGVSAGYLVTASFMSAPAAVMFAKIMVPEAGVPETSGAGATAARVDVPRLDVNVIDAAARGAGEGLQLALNVGGMLIAFVALVSMLDRGVGWLGGLVGHSELSLGRILGAPLTPLAYLMGVPWKEAPLVGSLLGTKTVLNEFIAYQAMTSHAAELSPRSLRITSFALCGFANFGSLAVVLGGLGGMVPERRKDLARLGLKSILAGSLATFLTGTIAGLVGG